ncbi:MAG: hypothetical protein Fues2KO_37270 [Fuerstiella sp.]
MSTATKSQSDSTHSEVRQSNDQSDMRPARDLSDYIREYARQKPDVAAMWCFGLGIFIGWKIKPW